MLIPTGTDAPIYHWPIATVGIMVVNFTVFFGTLMYDDPEFIAPYVLEYGNGLHPLQWVTSAFLHAGPMHLLGNMLFFWVFALVVEGKIGWWRMLLLYLGICCLSGVVEQTIMLGGEGGSLGASGAIYGLMGVCLVWAPLNNITLVFIWFISFMGRSSGQFEVPLIMMGLAKVFFQAIGAMQAARNPLNGGIMSSELLHLIGLFAGVPLGILFLRRGWVDCESWDFFSVMQGRHEMTAEERAVGRDDEDVKSSVAKERRRLQGQIEQLIAENNAALAWQAHLRMRSVIPEWELPTELLQAMIAKLSAAQQWEASVEPLAEYVTRDPDDRAAALLRLAQILAYRVGRPAQALYVLRQVASAELSDDQSRLYRKLKDHADQLHQQDPLEVIDEWFD